MLTTTLSSAIPTPQRPSSTSRRHAELRPASKILGACGNTRRLRSVRSTARVQSHELAHDPAARSWPRPRVRGARHLWTLPGSAPQLRRARRTRAARPPRPSDTVSVYNEPAVFLCVKGCCHLPYNSGLSVSRSRGVNHLSNRKKLGMDQVFVVYTSKSGLNQPTVVWTTDGSYHFFPV